MRRRAAGLALRVEAGRLSLLRCGRVTDKLVAEASWTDASELEERVRTACPTGARQSVAIELGESLVQRRTLRGLPKVPLRLLHPIVLAQVGRHFRAGQHPLTVAVVRHQGLVLGFAADETLLEALVRGVEAAGSRVSRISPPGKVGLFANLLPASVRASRARVRRSQAWRVLAGSLALWLVLGGVIGVRWAVELKALRRSADSLAVPLEALQAVRIGMDSAAATLDSLTRAEQGRRQVAIQVLRLAQSLPDSVVVTTLSLTSDGRGRLSGLGRRPLGVVAALDRTGAAVNPVLEGGTARETWHGEVWERFTVTFGGTTP